MYNLTDDEKEQIQNYGYDLGFEYFDNNERIESLYRSFSRNSFQNITTEDNKLIPVYKPELAYILTTKSLEVTIHMKVKKLFINGYDFIPDYYKGFVEGQKYFDENFAVPKELLYMPSKDYLQDLHDNYFHIKHKRKCNAAGFFEGWADVKKNYPLTLKPNIIYNYGYFSGIVNRVDELIKTHPNPFKDFNQCEKFKPLKVIVKAKIEREIPETFEELFYNPEHAEPCLKILSELQPPVIDAKNNYIGKAKGIFPLWIKVLKNHKPEPLIKHYKDTVYKDLLNNKVKGLNLSNDASEFRKQYIRLVKNKIELDIKTILSQYSQSGKLGK